ncbi:hypothetical protein MP228_000498 [Amoeboaphelidium protococcarum]|nr:hypothetical protein MP228_000498 [Amoeboaphelidium protococcarum]
MGVTLKLVKSPTLKDEDVTTAAQQIICCKACLSFIIGFIMDALFGIKNYHDLDALLRFGSMCVYNAFTLENGEGLNEKARFEKVRDFYVGQLRDKIVGCKVDGQKLVDIYQDSLNQVYKYRNQYAAHLEDNKCPMPSIDELKSALKALIYAAYITNSIILNSHYVESTVYVPFQWIQLVNDYPKEFFEGVFLQCNEAFTKYSGTLAALDNHMQNNEEKAIKMFEGAARILNKRKTCYLWASQLPQFVQYFLCLVQKVVYFSMTLLSTVLALKSPPLRNTSADFKNYRAACIITGLVAYHLGKQFCRTVLKIKFTKTDYQCTKFEGKVFDKAALLLLDQNLSHQLRNNLVHFNFLKDGLKVDLQVPPPLITVTAEDFEFEEQDVVLVEQIIKFRIEKIKELRTVDQS